MLEAVCGAGVAFERLATAVDRCAANCTLPAEITDAAAACVAFWPAAEEVVTLYWLATGPVRTAEEAVIIGFMSLPSTQCAVADGLSALVGWIGSGVIPDTLSHPD